MQTEIINLMKRKEHLVKAEKQARLSWYRASVAVLEAELELEAEIMRENRKKRVKK